MRSRTTYNAWAHHAVRMVPHELRNLVQWTVDRLLWLVIWDARMQQPRDVQRDPSKEISGIFEDLGGPATSAADKPRDACPRDGPADERERLEMGAAVLPGLEDEASSSESSATSQPRIPELRGAFDEWPGSLSTSAQCHWHELASNNLTVPSEMPEEEVMLLDGLLLYAIVVSAAFFLRLAQSQNSQHDALTFMQKLLSMEAAHAAADEATRVQIEMLTAAQRATNGGIQSCLDKVSAMWREEGRNIVSRLDAFEAKLEANGTCELEKQSEMVVRQGRRAAELNEQLEAGIDRLEALISLMGSKTDAALSVLHTKLENEVRE